MDKTELIDIVEARLMEQYADVKAGRVKRTLDLLIYTIEKHVAAGGLVRIRGLGTFKARRRARKIIPNNLGTAALAFIVASRKDVNFTASERFIKNLSLPHLE